MAMAGRWQLAIGMSPIATEASLKELVVGHGTTKEKNVPMGHVSELCISSCSSSSMSVSSCDATRAQRRSLVRMQV
jgi:hypothetical protein